jgi:hypothetical protein
VKARAGIDSAGQYSVAIWCTGCEQGHAVPLIGPVAWQWNGDTERPTIQPSIKITRVTGVDANNQDIKYICHSVITDGMIRFVDDSTHALSGKTVPLEDFGP